MKTFFSLLLSSFWLGFRHRALNVRVGLLSVCEDVKFGRYNIIHKMVRLRSVQLGDLTYVANGARIVNANIGKFCSIGPNCRIGLGLHPLEYVSSHPAFYSPSQPPAISFAVKEFEESRTVEIGNDVWIGESAMVFDGVRIGDGAIVGAGAVVTKDVAPYAVVAGVPARQLRLRFPADDVDFLLRTRWWERDLDWLRRHAAEFDSPARLRQLLAAETPT